MSKNNNIINSFILNCKNNNNLLKIFPFVVNATEIGAISSFLESGKKNNINADYIASTSIRSYLNTIDIDGIIKVGEGERDNAPMLKIGEKVGTGNGIKIDIAIDPLECTNFLSSGLPGSLSVIAITNRDGFFCCPDIYFDKIVVGTKVFNYMNNRNNKVDINNSVYNNIQIISNSLNKEISELSIVILNRKRNLNLINELRELNVKLLLIDDGDLWPGILTCIENSGIDAVFGSGGSSEAFLTASALKCMGGYITGKLFLPSVINNLSENNIQKEYESIISRFNYFNSDPYNLFHSLSTNDLIKSEDVIFSVSSITGNSILNPILLNNNTITVNSFFSVSKSINKFNNYGIISNKYII